MPSEVFTELPDWPRGAPDLLIYSLDPPPRLGQTRIQTGSENSTDQRWVPDWRERGGGGGPARSGRTAVCPPGPARLRPARSMDLCCVLCLVLFGAFLRSVAARLTHRGSVRKLDAPWRVRVRTGSTTEYVCQLPVISHSITVFDGTVGGSAQCIGSVWLHHSWSIHFQSTNSHDPSVDYMRS